MKKNKVISLVLVGLISAFALMGCSSKVGDKVVDNNETPVETQNNEVSPETEVNENAEPETNVETPVVGDADLDPLDAMITSSDYISKIKLIKKGENTTEVKILDNIKANLSESDLPVIENLELNRAYVVFLKNADKSVVLTNETGAVILLEGDNHELFEKINNHIHR